MDRIYGIVRNRDLFPDKWGFAIFVAYMGLFVNQGLLVTASRHGTQTYPYNPTTVVLFTEVLKLAISSTVFLKDHTVISLFRELYAHSAVLAYYMIPAFLYCLYNNLSFTNLASFDPTTYFMFMQIRLLMTGLIYQILFKRRLSKMQWFSLLLVTVGCMIQKLDIGSAAALARGGPNAERVNGLLRWRSLLSLSTGFVFIMIQICCSVFAGVYNEYLIKRVAGGDVHIMVQNVFMYLDSIVCNLAVLLLKGDLGTAFNSASLTSMMQVFVLAIMVNNALVGIITSLFLKSLNSILKAFASALELVFTAVLSFVFLGIPIHWNTAVAVAIVSYAVVLYARNPIKSPGAGGATAAQDGSAKAPLLDKVSEDEDERSPV